MALKNRLMAFVSVCISAILVIALCGCDDLGAYEDTEEYYSAFGDVITVSGSTKDKESYSVEDYFYNKESRENFLTDKDGNYTGVEHSDYVYLAIPFGSTVNVDAVALYSQSRSDVTVYLNVLVADKVPSNPRTSDDNVIGAVDGGVVFDDPDPAKRVGEITVHLKKDKWSSFTVDTFSVNGQTKKSIEIKEDEYILLQIRNNSGVREFDDEKQAFVDLQTGLELQKAEITMTNLLIRALEVKSDN